VTRQRRSDDPVADILRRLGSEDRQAAWAEFIEAYSPIILQVIRCFEKDPDHVADAFVAACEHLSQNRFRRLRRFRPAGPASFTTWLRAVVRNVYLDWCRREFGRHRVFQSIARLPLVEQEVFRSVYWEGLGSDAAFVSLRARFPDLTREWLSSSIERIGQSLTSRQRWLLSIRRPTTVALDDGSDRTSPGDRVANPGPDPESLVVQRETEEQVVKALSNLAKSDRLLLRLRFEQGLTLAEVARLTGLENPQRADRRINKILEKLRNELDS
jgi:RNA polymerase sigma factor (sigma-70 family)